MTETETQEKFEGAKHIKKQVDDYDSLSDSEIETERLGGLSNQIWKVSAKGKKHLIYRKFGDACSICDRDRENYILEGLSKKGIAPKFYGGNKKYRIEKFLKGKEMTPSALQDKKLRRRMAKLLAELHNMQFDKLDKTPAFLKLFKDDGFIKEFKDKAEKEEVFAPEEKKHIDEMIKLVNEDEISFLKSIAPKGKNSVVFSHNDMHSQNILEIEDPHKYILIDFEYSDYNYRGYDIANIFNEANFEYDVKDPPHYKLDESNAPSDNVLREFIRYYLFFSKYNSGEVDEDGILNHDSYREEYIRKNLNIDTFNKEVQEIFDEAKVCQIFSHYFWVLWSVIKSKEEGFDFDHIHYARTRYDIYQKLKNEYSQKKAQANQENDDHSVP